VHGASYQLQQLVARGGMGAVYLARYRDEADFECEVAIKLLRRDVGEPEELGRRLRDEARLLGLLRHPAIVRVDRLTLLDGRWALVMEYVDGLDLRQLASSLRVPTGVALEIVEVVADALDAAGRACDPQGRPLLLQHRDIKPSNIMITAHGEVKVLDFGVAQARFHGRESATQSLLLGTSDYMAPERLAGGQGSPAADVFSLGVVLWEVLAGERLGQSSPQLLAHRDWLHAGLERLRHRRPRAPVALFDLLERMLAWSPQERVVAAALVDEASTLARGFEGARLRAWCRGELRGRPRPVPEDDALVGAVLSAGSSLPAQSSWSVDDEPTWDDRTAVGSPPVPVVTGPSPRDGALVPPDDEPLSRPSPPVAPVVVPVALPAAAPSRAGRWLVLLAGAVVAIAGMLVFVLYSSQLRPQPAPPLAPQAEPIQVQPVVDVPPSSPPASVSDPPHPRPAPIMVPPTAPRVPASVLEQADDGDGGSPRPPVEVPTEPQPTQDVVWGDPRPGGTLSTAGLAPAPDGPARVWGAQDDVSTQGVSWTDGVRVQLSGDATEVVLVDESRGFPVPGVVPAGSWFVRVRFGDAEPVVAGVVELAGPGPRTLSCDAHLSWCSIVP